MTTVKMQNLKELLGEVSRAGSAATWFFISATINFCVLFSLSPVLARYVDKESFGAIGLLFATSLTISVFNSLGLITSVSLANFDGSIGKTESNALLAFLTTAAITIILLLSFFIFQDAFSQTQRYLLFWSPIIAFLYSCRDILLAQARSNLAGRTFFIVSSFGNFFPFAIGLLSILWFTPDLIVFTLGYVAGFMPVIILLLNYLRNIYLDKSFIKRSFHRSLPLLPHSVSLLLILSLDRFSISHTLGNESTAYYQLVYTFGMSSFFALGILNNILSIAILKRGKSLTDQMYLSIVKWTLVFSLSLALLVLIASPWILSIIVPEAYDLEVCRQIVSYMVFIGPYYALYLIGINRSIAQNQNRDAAYATPIISLISVLSINFLLNRFGIVGASMNLAMSFFLLSCYYNIFGKKRRTGRGQIMRIIALITILNVILFALRDFISTVPSFLSGLLLVFLLALSISSLFFLLRICKTLLN